MLITFVILILLHLIMGAQTWGNLRAIRTTNKYIPFQKVLKTKFLLQEYISEISNELQEATNNIAVNTKEQIKLQQEVSKYKEFLR